MEKRKPRHWDETGVPLGGIGAGKIEFCPSGKFTHITAHNNWDAPICTGAGPTTVPTYTPEGVEGSFFAIWTARKGARALKLTSYAPFATLTEDDIIYCGRFPRAWVRYANVGCELELEAFSPLHLHSDGGDHYRDSSLPIALFTFTVRNPGQEPLPISLAFSWEGMIGHGGYVSPFEARILYPNPEFGRVVPREDGIYPGLWFADPCTDTDPRVHGTYSLMCRADAEATVTYLAGWNTHRNLNGITPFKLWQDFAEDGRFDNLCGDGRAGVLAVSLTLPPGAEEKVTFALAWFFPHLVGSAPGNCDHGHAYANWFSDSWDVATYGLDNLESLYQGTVVWQEALERSNLPPWLVEKLCNDLFPLFSNTWYDARYRCSVNESPTSMRGCAGTIDQRAASNSVYTMCFPELSKAELTLFAEQQIKATDPFRYGLHWNCETGRCDLMLDREGAIRHDVGWDHLEGGRFGSGPNWLTLHWPDLATVFVLQNYEYLAWTGDREYLSYIYPKIKRALAFEERLDQNGDGIADLWGPGCCTYDNIHFPYYGASSFVATLHLAALRAGERLAELQGDEAFAQRCRDIFARVRDTVENVLWDEERGYYLSWLDETAENWADGPRPHPDRSENCMVAQLAGQWFANLLHLGDLLPAEHMRRALRYIAEKNVGLVKGCPANEVTPADGPSFSWPYYVETYALANMIYQGDVEAAVEGFRRIYHAMYEVDGSPWNATLVWEGEDNTERGWGRWYMTQPASWFILPALAGFALDLLRGEMVLAPNPIPEDSTIRRLHQLPLFMPRFWATVDCEQRRGEIQTTFRVTRMIGEEPAALERFVTRLPRDVDPDSVCKFLLYIEDRRVIHLSDCEFDKAGGEIAWCYPFRLSQPGDQIMYKIKWSA